MEGTKRFIYKPRQIPLRRSVSKPIILDTSAFISLGNIDDSNYEKARSIGTDIEEKKLNIVVPGEIFTEIINVVGKKIGHRAAILQSEKILKSESFTITETTHQIRMEALEKFARQPKSVSFTDCIVMAFADEYETREIFGFDNAFRKNGYMRFGIDKSEVKSPK